MVLTPPVGVVDLAPPVGVVDVASQVGVRDLSLVSWCVGFGLHQLVW